VGSVLLPKLGSTRPALSPTESGTGPATATEVLQAMLERWTSPVAFAPSDRRSQTAVVKMTAVRGVESTLAFLNEG
jgi:hypothetical protein